MGYHDPVLLRESVDSVVLSPDGVYVDATYGGGGHSSEILSRLDNGRLVAFDQDKDAQSQLLDDPRFTFVDSNFKNLERFLKYHGAYPVDGILADLGVSSHQIDEGARGFSYRSDDILDMRMNARSGKSARDVVNGYEQQALADVFYKYGELHEGRILAARIAKCREAAPICTTFQLVEAVRPCLPKGRENKHLSRIFQAIRIEVNDEMSALESFLRQTVSALNDGGRLAVISYHSLEDRLVKNFMRSGNFQGEVEKDFFGNPQTPFKVITRKPLLPSEEEISVNTRARSAKLRVAEKTTPVKHEVNI